MTDYSTYSDQQLLELLKASDHAAFTEIFSRFGALLFSITQRRINDIELSKDLVQEVFADVWEKRLILNVPGNLQSFLITVIKNRILDHYKHQKVNEKYIDHFQHYLNTTENKTDHLLRHKDFSALIEQEIAALPEKMRVVFELSKKNHMNRKEIAAYLNVPEGNVKINLQRSIKLLKTRLGLFPMVIVIIHFIFNY